MYIYHRKSQRLVHIKELQLFLLADRSEKLPLYRYLKRGWGYQRKHIWGVKCRNNASILRLMDAWWFSFPLYDVSSLRTKAFYSLLFPHYLEQYFTNNHNEIKLLTLSKILNISTYPPIWQFFLWEIIFRKKLYK